MNHVDLRGFNRYLRAKVVQFYRKYPPRSLNKIFLQWVQVTLGKKCGTCKTSSVDVSLIVICSFKNEARFPMNDSTQNNKERQ